MRILFDHGTLVFTEASDDDLESLPGVSWDPRVALWRAPAYRHWEIVRELRRQRIPFEDEAAHTFVPLFDWQAPELRVYQQAALLSWGMADRRGIAVLPTGSGKTRLALAAMAETERPTLVMAPTRALVQQWIAELKKVYGGEIGCLGDGEHKVESVTVATFESAWRFMGRYGARFELVVIDEVHHFGGGLRDEALEMCVAPLRLGLTATPPEEPALDHVRELVGPIVYQLGLGDLAGTFLADFELAKLRLPFNQEERRTYLGLRRVFLEFYRPFMRAYPASTWLEFSQMARQTEEGRAALLAWQKSREQARWTRAKSCAVAELLLQHRDNKVLVFTADNTTAYAIAREHLIMPMTCDIKKSERDRALDDFKHGRIRGMVSSRVLNEGLDVPDADVAIIVAGTRGDREYLQRIGRLLRPAPGKRALVYELVTLGTNEERISAGREWALSARFTPPPKAQHASSTPF